MLSGQSLPQLCPFSPQSTTGLKGQGTVVKLFFWTQTVQVGVESVLTGAEPQGGKPSTAFLKRGHI